MAELLLQIDGPRDGDVIGAYVVSLLGIVMGIVNIVVRFGGP